MNFFLKQFQDIKNFGFLVLKKKIYLLLKLLLYLPLYTYGFLVCICLVLIKFFFYIRVNKLPSENFGDLVIQTSLYYLKKKCLKNSNLKVKDFLYIEKKKLPINKKLIEIFKNKIKIYPSFFLKPIFEITNRFVIFEKFQISIFSNRMEYDEENLFEKFNIIKLQEFENNKGEQLLHKEFGVRPADKLVFLAVRDSSFTELKSSALKTDFSHNSFRDYDIYNFKKATEFLIEKGFYVFRMGRKAEKHFNLNNSYLVDYANSNIKNDFLDLYIANRCEFCISTGFGLDSLPYVAGKPIALITVPIGDFRSHSERIFLSTKRHYDLILKRDLTLEEIFERKLAFAMQEKNFLNSNIKLIEPTQLEIKEFIEEFYKKIYLKKSFSQEELKKQIIFKKKYLECFRKSNYTLNKKKYYNNLHTNFNSYFSNSFLNKNKNWLN